MKGAMKMIIDKLKNTGLYFGINSNIDKAIKYLNSTELADLKTGRYEISGDDIFALVHEYETNTIESSVWEGHRDHIDLQVMIRGHERLGYSNIDEMEIYEEYPETKDFLCRGEGSYLRFEQGYFALLFPEDVHMPGVDHDKRPGAVKKMVIKIRAI
jgi:biofilm protein TabA